MSQLLTSGNFCEARAAVALASMALLGAISKKLGTNLVVSSRFDWQDVPTSTPPICSTIGATARQSESVVSPNSSLVSEPRNERAACTDALGLTCSSLTSSWIWRPSTPPASLICLTASSAPARWDCPIWANGPEIVTMAPSLMGPLSPLSPESPDEPQALATIARHPMAANALKGVDRCRMGSS